MNCRETIEFLMGYLDGQLASEERAEFERHLAKCTHCANYLQTYEHAIRAGKGCAEAENDSAESLPEELVRAVLAAKKKGETGGGGAGA